MSSESGTSNRILSLPKGGGAIRGIGETFQPNATSPGRVDFGPQLSPQHSTDKGNAIGCRAESTCRPISVEQADLVQETHEVTGHMDISEELPFNPIAEHQDISPKYLENLLAALNSAGLVRSIRGPEGGHMLTRPPAQINLRQIYHVFEGTEGFVDPEYCDRTDNCVTQEVWAQMYDACMEILESTTLEDRARRTGEKEEGP